MFVMARWHGVQMLVPAAAASHPLHFLADNTAWAAWRGREAQCLCLEWNHEIILIPTARPQSRQLTWLPRLPELFSLRLALCRDGSCNQWQDSRPIKVVHGPKPYTPTPANLAKCTSHGLILQGLQGVSRERSFSWSILSKVSPRHSNPAMTRNIGLWMKRMNCADKLQWGDVAVDIISWCPVMCATATTLIYSQNAKCKPDNLMIDSKYSQP